MQGFGYAKYFYCVHQYELLIRIDLFIFLDNFMAKYFSISEQQKMIVPPNVVSENDDSNFGTDNSDGWYYSKPMDENKDMEKLSMPMTFESKSKLKTKQRMANEVCVVNLRLQD